MANSSAKFRYLSWLLKLFFILTIVSKKRSSKGLLLLAIIRFSLFCHKITQNILRKTIITIKNDLCGAVSLINNYI